MSVLLTLNLPAQSSKLGTSSSGRSLTKLIERSSGSLQILTMTQTVTTTRGAFSALSTESWLSCLSFRDQQTVKTIVLSKSWSQRVGFGRSSRTLR